MDTIDASELDALGLLRTTKVPTGLDWMTDEEKLLLLRLLFCGEHGMHAREVKRIQKTASGADCVLRIEAYGLAQWETDANGRGTALVLTEKGEEGALLVRRIAQNENKKSVAKERRHG